MAEGRLGRKPVSGPVRFGRSYMRRKKGVNGDRYWRNLKAGEFKSRMLDTKVSRLEEGPRRDTLLHSLTSAYSDVSKEAFEASAISIEEWTEFKCCRSAGR
jgi:hypothetical protein